MTLLSGHVNRCRVTAALNKLPEKLGDAYDEVWDRIFSQDEDRQTIARAALTWITYAKERLTADMLLRAIALSLEPDMERIEDEDLIDVELLLSSCVGLVILNQDDGIIRLVHFTTQDYLERRLARIDANTSIARVCLMCFGLEGLREIPEIEDRSFRTPLRIPSFPGEFQMLGNHLFLTLFLFSFILPVVISLDALQLPPLFASCVSIAKNCWWATQRRTGVFMLAKAGRKLEDLVLSTLRTQDIRDRIDTYDFAFRYSGTYNGNSLLSLLHLVSRYGLSRICSKLLNDGKLFLPCQILV